MQGGQALRRAQIGAIFVEFAIAIPVLIAIIYYLHDVPKYKRVQAKMEFVAHNMIGMLQNISRNGTPEKITLTNIRNIVTGAYLAFYPGMTMYATGSQCLPLGHFPLGYIYYVIGEDNNTASVIWGVHFHMDNLRAYKVECVGMSASHGYSYVQYLRKQVPSKIHPKLVIKPGEVKIIVECVCCYHHTVFSFSDGRLCSNVPAKEAFGFYILSPKAKSTDGFFNSIVIFTPKPGLFDGTVPK
jgi:hypothetical protein